jgi:hypothetical protein
MNHEQQLDHSTEVPVEQHQAEIISDALKKPYDKPQLTVYGRLQHMTLSSSPGAGGGDPGGEV